MDAIWQSVQQSLMPSVLADGPGLLLAGLTAQFLSFVFVLFRMSGMMIIGPFFGRATIPMNVRALLALGLSLIVTPVVHEQAAIGFQRLDINHDGRLLAEEIPEAMLPRLERTASAIGHDLAGGLTLAEYQLGRAAPVSLIELTITIAAEVALGVVLGLGITIVLSALELAGQLIDQQTGLGLGEVFNPDLGQSTSMTGQLLAMLGTAMLLSAEPLSAHLAMLQALLETFQFLPPGEATVTTSAIDLLRDLVHQSMSLALRIAMPVLAIMSLVSLTMGFLGHSVPQINVLVIGFAVRAMVSLAILTLSLGAGMEAFVNAFPPAFDELRAAISLLNEGT